jgi:signal recognition particle receptor subunit beta
MVQFNNTDKEMSLKVVYVGCALGGKTTSLERLHECILAPQRSRLVSLNTANDRTLFFDLLPIDLGQVGGYSVKLQLFTVPGQVQYHTTRRAVLTGVDAVVVVVDSSPDRARENRDALQELVEHLKFHGLDIRTIPLVLQFNKRDLPNALPLEDLNRRLNPRGWPFYEAVATTGEGIVEPFLKAAVQAADQIVARYKFPLSFGARLASTLEHLLSGPPTPAPEIAHEPHSHGGDRTVDEGLAALAEPEADSEAAEPLSLEERAAGRDAIRTAEESLAQASAAPAGGSRQRIRSSVDSSEAVNTQLLVQGAIEAQEAMAMLGAELDRARQKLALREGALAELGRIARTAIAPQKLSEILEQSLKALAGALPAAGGAILLPEPGSVVLKESAIEGFETDPINTLPCKGFPSLASGLFSRTCPSVSPDPTGNPNPIDRHLQRWKIVSHAAVPVQMQGRPLGMLTAYRVEPQPLFDKADLAFLSAVSTLISAAIELSRLRR